MVPQTMRSEGWMAPQEGERLQSFYRQGFSELWDLEPLSVQHCKLRESRSSAPVLPGSLGFLGSTFKVQIEWWPELLMLLSIVFRAVVPNQQPEAH